jgi:hypothetical protein
MHGTTNIQPHSTQPQQVFHRVWSDSFSISSSYLLPFLFLSAVSLMQARSCTQAFVKAISVWYDMQEKELQRLLAPSAQSACCVIS